MTALDYLQNYFGIDIPNEHLHFCIRMSEYSTKKMPGLHQGKSWLGLHPNITRDDVPHLHWVISQWSNNPNRFNTAHSIDNSDENLKYLSTSLMTLHRTPWIGEDTTLRQDLLRLRKSIAIDEKPYAYWSIQNIANIATQDTIDSLLNTPLPLVNLIEPSGDIYTGPLLFHTQRNLVRNWSVLRLNTVCDQLKTVIGDIPENLQLNVFGLELYFMNKFLNVDIAKRIGAVLRKHYMKKTINNIDDSQLIFNYSQIKYICDLQGCNIDIPKPRIIAATETMVESFHDHWLDRANQYMTLHAYQ